MSSAFIKFGFMAICLSFSLSSTSSFAKEYYKWVDAKGSTHYTATPPPKSAQKKGKIATYGSNNHTQQAKNSATETAEENHASKEIKNHVNTGVATANAGLNVGQEVERPSNPTKASIVRE